MVIVIVIVIVMVMVLLMLPVQEMKRSIEMEATDGRGDRSD